MHNVLTSIAIARICNVLQWDRKNFLQNKLEELCREQNGEEGAGKHLSELEYFLKLYRSHTCDMTEECENIVDHIHLCIGFFYTEVEIDYNQYNYTKFADLTKMQKLEYFF